MPKQQNPSIGMSDFIKIVSATGAAKVRAIAEVKNRPPYEPKIDYYKAFREGVKSIHKDGKPKTALKEIMNDISADKKPHFTDIIQGYGKWWGKKEIEWIGVPSPKVITGDNVDLRINPEMSLKVDGEVRLIKLYLSAPKLNKARIDMINHLLRANIAAKGPTQFGTLVVRDAKFAPHTKLDPFAERAVDAELKYISGLWDSV